MSMQAYESGSGSPDPFSHVRTAFQILAEGAPQVAQSLLNVAVNGKSEIARVTAAQAVMDRIGMHPRVDVGLSPAILLGGAVNTGTGPSAVDTVRARLQLLATQHVEMVEGQVEEEEGGHEAVVLRFPLPETGAEEPEE